MKNRFKIALLTLVGGLLFLTVLFSALLWFVAGTFLPLIISGVLFTAFAIFAKVKYGLKIVEPLSSESVDSKYNSSDKYKLERNEQLTNPTYSYLPENIYYDK